MKKSLLFLALITQLCAPEEVSEDTVSIFVSGIGGRIESIGENPVLQIPKEEYLRLIQHDEIRSRIQSVLPEKYRDWEIIWGSERKFKFPEAVTGGRLEVNLIKSELVDMSEVGSFLIEQPNGLNLRFSFSGGKKRADWSSTSKMPRHYLDQYMGANMRIKEFLFINLTRGSILRVDFISPAIDCTPGLVDFILEHSVNFEKILLQKSKIEIHPLDRKYFIYVLGPIHRDTFNYMLRSVFGYYLPRDLPMDPEFLAKLMDAIKPDEACESGETAAEAEGEL